MPRTGSEVARANCRRYLSVAPVSESGPWIRREIRWIGDPWERAAEGICICDAKVRTSKKPCRVWFADEGPIGVAASTAGNLDEIAATIHARGVKVREHRGIGSRRFEGRFRIHRLVVLERVGDRAAAAQ